MAPCKHAVLTAANDDLRRQRSRAPSATARAAATRGCYRASPPDERWHATCGSRSASCSCAGNGSRLSNCGNGPFSNVEPHCSWQGQAADADELTLEARRMPCCCRQLHKKTSNMERCRTLQERRAVCDWKPRRPWCVSRQRVMPKVAYSREAVRCDTRCLAE